MGAGTARVRYFYPFLSTVFYEGNESLHSGQGNRFSECSPLLEHMLWHVVCYAYFGNGQIFQVGAGTHILTSLWMRWALLLRWLIIESMFGVHCTGIAEFYIFPIEERVWFKMWREAFIDQLQIFIAYGWC